MPQFLLDHTTLDHTALHVGEGQTSELNRIFETLIEIIETIKENDSDLVKSTQALYVETLPGVQLWEILYDRNYSFIDPVLLQALGRSLERITDSEEEDIFRYARDRVANGTAIALVSAVGIPVDLSAIEGIYRVSDRATLLRFYRKVFAFENTTEDAFWNMAEVAFPQLWFHRERTKFNQFKQPYAVTRSMVVKHLAAINDDFRSVATTCKSNPDCIDRHFSGVHTVNISPESPKTHSNTAAMRQRVVRIRAIDYTCEWHSKLSPTTDRIHFCAGENAELGGRILIGIFAEHLDT